VLDGDPRKKGHSLPQCLAHVYCGQTAGWIKMPLGTEVCLGPGDIVLDADPAAQPPIFSQCLLWPNDWMHQYTAWYGGKPRPRRHCVRWGLSCPLKGAEPPNFRPMSIVANRRPSQLLLTSCSKSKHAKNTSIITSHRTHRQSCSKNQSMFIIVTLYM